jgi:type I restriction enzyme S subunit
MMEKRVPELRFMGFEDEWKKEKLGDVVKINQGLQIAISERLTEKVEGSYFYITNEFLRENSEKKFFIKNPPKSVLCTKDDILMTRTGNTGMVVTNVEGAFHNNFFKIAYPDYINKNFLFHFLILPHTQNQILKLAGTSTIPDLNHSDFYRIEIPIPSLPEQQKIAAFFTAINEKLQGLRKKQSLLEAWKRGLMQRIFSGELRFKDEDGGEFEEWEEKALGDVLDYEQPTKYLVSSTEYNDSFETPVLTAGKTFILGYTNETHGVYKSNLPIIIFDDFTTAIQFVDFPFKAKSSAMKILVPKAGVNISFVYAAMQLLEYVVGGHERHWISKYSRLSIPFPSLEEQNRIANFLSSIDEKITQCSQQIEKAEAWKKGLMQRMFV